MSREQRETLKRLTEMLYVDIKTGVESICAFFEFGTKIASDNHGNP